MPGYQTFAGYQPDAKVFLVVAINTDVVAYTKGEDVGPADLVTEAVTTIVTPDTPFTAASL